MNTIATIPAVLRGSARRIISSLALALLAGVAMLAPSASAQTEACIANNGANEINFSGPLIFGHVFQVNNAGIEVSQLGFFDGNNQPLTYSHAVTLFNGENPIATVTIQAGSATNFISGFAYAALPTPIYLPAGQYTVLAYGMCNGGADLEGDDTGNISFNNSANMTVGNGCYDFTSQGSPDYPGGIGDISSGWNVGGWDYNSASASFIYTNVVGGAAATWTGGGGDNNWSTSGNWNVPLVSPAPLTFAGFTRLTNNNDLSGITAESITFDLAAGAFVLGGNDITLSGNIGFNGNPATPITQTVNLNMAWSGHETIDTPTNGSLVLGGNITSASLLTTTDYGTLTLGGTNSIECMGIDGLTGSATIITGNTAISGTGDHLYVGEGETVANCNGTLVIQPGAVLTVTGNFGDTFVIGRDDGSGTVVQNGGTFTFNPSNMNRMLLGATGDSATRSEYHMNGGLLDMRGNNLSIGWGSTFMTGAVYQVSGVITNLNEMRIPQTSGGANGIGVYTLSGGSVYLLGGGIVTDGSRHEIDLGHGTVGAEVNWASSLSMNLTNLGGGSVTFDTGAGNTITLSGVLSGTGGLTVAGSGTLELSGANSYTGDTIVNAGTLQLDQTGSSVGAIRLANGALLNLNFSGNYATAQFFTNGVALPVGTYNAGNLPAYITGSGNLVVSSSISTGHWTGLGANNNWSTGGNWDQNAVPIFPIGLTFAGSTRLANNNDLSSITASSITFDAAAGAFVLNGNGITLAGNIGFNGNPATPITQTVNFNMALSASETIDTPTNGNMTLDGSLTSSVDTSLIKIDAGTLTLGGANTIQSWDLNGGTTTITGNTTINGTGGRIYVGDGDYLAGCNGTLVIQPGAVLNITGTFGDTFVIGRDAASGGTVIQNGGTFTFNPSSNGRIVLGATSNPNLRSEYDMNGGLLDMQGWNFSVGWAPQTGSIGLLKQVGGGITNLNELRIPFLNAGSDNGLGVYTLSGGSIYLLAGGIVNDGPNYVINLGGGTVGAEVSWSSSMNMNLTNLNGSVTFDTGAGNTITLSGALSGNGGLTNIGSGILELSGANSYAGDTVVNAGSTLKLDVTGSSAGAFRLANGATLNLNYSGNYFVASFYTNGVSLPAGTYNNGNLSTFISGTGNLVVSGGQPTMTQDLVPVTKFVGSPAVLTFGALGGNLHYYWYRNSVLLPSQTNTTLNFAAVALSDDANYSVTASNAVGTVSSSTVHLTVLQQTLTHRYGMDDANVTDSIGGANGAPVNNAGFGNIVFTNGAAVYPGQGNAGQCSYISLPPGLITGYNSLTLELWATIQPNGNWNEICAFGEQDGGGGGLDYVIVVPHSGPGDYRMTIKTGGNERVTSGATTIDTRTPVHITAVYDADQNQMRLYANGVLVSTTSTTIDLGNVNNVLSWIGRGLFNGDASFKGSINEVRIWNGPLTPLQISVNDGLGANVVNTNPGAFLNLSSVSVPSTTMLVGGGQQATALATFANVANVPLNSQVTNWVSSNPGVATVNGSGLVIAVGAGTTTISATAGGSTATSTLITVSSAQTLACVANGFTFNGGDTIDTFDAPFNFGQTFTVSNGGIEVSQLGIFDYQNQPLAYSHSVTLFTNQTAIATVTVPAGTATNLTAGFAYVSLPTPIHLPAGNYTVVAYGFYNDGIYDYQDTIAENGSIGFNNSANMTVVTSCFDPGAPASPAYPSNVGWDEPSASASFTYVDTVATPPVVNHPVISGGNLILTGSGGTAGAGYTWLTTTNVATPIASWTTNTVGNFDGSGNFSNAIPVTKSTPAQFFRLRTP